MHLASARCQRMCPCDVSPSLPMFNTINTRHLPFQARYLNSVLQWSLVASFVLLLFLLALTLSWKIKGTRSEVEKEHVICQLCASLKTNDNEDFPEGCSVQGELCCCKASIVINRTVKKVSRCETNCCSLQTRLSVYR